MSVGMTVLCIILTVVVAAALGILLYLICSPMPVVKLLRRQEDGEIKRAPEYEKARGKVRIRLTHPGTGRTPTISICPRKRLREGTRREKRRECP